MDEYDPGWEVDSTDYPDVISEIFGDIEGVEPELEKPWRDDYDTVE